MYVNFAFFLSFAVLLYFYSYFSLVFAFSFFMCPSSQFPFPCICLLYHNLVLIPVFSLIFNHILTVHTFFYILGIFFPFFSGLTRLSLRFSSFYFSYIFLILSLYLLPFFWSQSFFPPFFSIYSYSSLFFLCVLSWRLIFCLSLILVVHVFPLRPLPRRPSFRPAASPLPCSERPSASPGRRRCSGAASRSPSWS